MEKLKKVVKDKLVWELLIIGIVFIILIASNYSSAEFFKATLVDIVSIGVVVLFTFFWTEKINDSRRKNDCIEHVIMEIQKMVSDSRIFSFDKRTLLLQASCANKIKYLQDANFKQIKEDVNFIADKFIEIRDLYSNHNQNENSLKEVEVDFEKYQSLICDKCDKIRIELYK